MYVCIYVCMVLLVCTSTTVFSLTIFVYTDISTPNGNCSYGDLRLEGGTDDTQAATREGRVEICINNAWGTVCNNLFGRDDAEVVCQQLAGLQRDGKFLYALKDNT